MSQYNKTVLTNAGLALAKRANAGQAKFEITRAVTSADDWSNKTIQDLEEVTAIPNIMQQGTIRDTEEVESNNSVIGVSLCFANKDLSAGYQIRIIGLYVKEEGQENDFLYAVTTAVTPEYMPDFNDKVLYRFNTQMYLVIGKAQAVNVVINDGASVTHGQFDKYKGEVTADLEKIENAHKEDMSHVVKSASINGGDEILPNEAGKLELVVPDPDLSKYVSLEQLTELLKSKADITAIPDKTATEEGIKQAKELAQEANTKAQNALDNKADKTTIEGDLATKANASDLSALQNSAMQVIDGNSGDDILSFRDEKIRCYNSVQNVKNLPDMSNKNWFYVITHTKKGWGSVTIISQDNCYWQNVLNGSSWSGWVHVANLNDIDDMQAKSYFRKQGMNQNGDLVEIHENAVKQANGGYAFDIFGSDQTASKLKDVLSTLPDKADKSQVNVDGSLFRMVAAGKTWNDILGFDNNGTSALLAFRGNTGDAMDNLLGNYSAGVAFGGGDTKGFLEVSYGDHNARIGGGNGSAPVWHEDIAWKRDVNDLQNQIQQLKDNQFEVQTFKDEASGAAWEAQKSGHRLAIIQS